MVDEILARNEVKNLSEYSKSGWNLFCFVEWLMES